MPTMTPQQFVEKWRKSKLSERAGAQSHFTDLCHLLGVPSPTDADVAGDTYTFEKGAAKTAGITKGDRGWADVWKHGYFGWEYKKGGANLDNAYQQLLQYREALENPPLLVVSDMRRIEVHTNITNTVKQVYAWELDDLLKQDRLDQLRRVWTDPFALKPTITTAQVTEQAAREFARLAELLRKWGEPADKAAHFLIRILFCLFTEDVGLLPEGLFAKLVDRTRSRPKDFAANLRQLFGAMRDGSMFLLENIPHFNGGLFDTDDVIELDSDGLAILHKASTLRWDAIEPAILGTLFERSLDPDKRSQLGAHYTSKDAIGDVIEPTLMVPLRRKWTTIEIEARELAAKRDAANGNQRPKLTTELERLLVGFHHQIAAVRILDPACGSGNFLYVALKQLMSLEKEVIVTMGDLGLTRPFPAVSPEQLYGIELNEYAHELAQITVWIGYIQALRDNGWGRPSEPILKPLTTIKRMDAVLHIDEHGNPSEPVWPEADVIVGNPPFLGDKKMRTQLGDAYVEHLRNLYANRLPSGVDFVTYWFEKARTSITDQKVKRVGLLATNSIRTGANRRVLDAILQTGSIFMAWSDRAWTLDGADVRVSIIAFDDGSEHERHLNGQLVQTIHADLTAAANMTTAQQLKENANICFLGIMKGGPFDLDAPTAERMLRSSFNPNGRPNSDVVKRSLGAHEVTKRNQNTWIIDFGVNTSLEDASQYELPFEYVRKHVKPLRDTNRRQRRREQWWIFGEPCPNLRAALKGLSRCIVTPEVSKYRVFAWMDTTVIPDHKLHIFARDDDYFFGILHSKVHEVWSLAQCSWMGVGNDPSYSSSRTFGTFPFPWVPSAEPHEDARVAAIAQAAKDLVEKRDRWLNPEGADEATLKKRTLTNLYNDRPMWLDLAHKKLDLAVLDAYGWEPTISDEDILARLLALNLERAAKQE